MNLDKKNPQNQNATSASNPDASYGLDLRDPSTTKPQIGLTATSLLGAGWRLFKSNAWTFILIQIFPFVTGMLMSLPFAMGWDEASLTGVLAITLMIPLVFYIYFKSQVSLLTTAIGLARTPSKISFEQAWRSSNGRLIRYAIANIIFFILAGIPMLIGLFAVISSYTSNSTELLWAGILAAVAATLALMLVYIFFLPVVVDRREPLLKSLGLSRQLATGYRLKIILAVLMLFLIALLPMLVPILNIIVQFIFGSVVQCILAVAYVHASQNNGLEQTKG